MATSSPPTLNPPPTHLPVYTCPMHPEVEQDGPGSCPRCGMALEPLMAAPPMTHTTWTCPMHPEVTRDELGLCLICGMALEPTTMELDTQENPELEDMTRRFLFAAALSTPLFLIVMLDMLPGQPVSSRLPGPHTRAVEAVAG